MGNNLEKRGNNPNFEGLDEIKEKWNSYSNNSLKTSTFMPPPTLQSKQQPRKTASSI